MRKGTEIFKRNIKEISLFNRKLLLCELTTEEYYDFIHFIINENQNKEISFLRFQNTHMLNVSLQYNIEKTWKIRFIKRRVLRKILSEKFLRRNVGHEVISEHVKTIFKLGGFEISDEKRKRKVGEGDNFLGQEQGYSLLIKNFNWTVKQIHSLPISKYFMLKMIMPSTRSEARAPRALP